MSLRCSRFPRGVLIALIGYCVAVALAVPPVQAADPARVTLNVDSRSDGMFRVTAAVVDTKGAPVAGARVVIKVRATFGWLPIAKGSTDATGRTGVALPPSFRSGEVTAEAGDDGEISATVRLGTERFAEPGVRPGRDVLSRLAPQPGFISPYPVLIEVAFLAVILGGIWTTYGYMVWLLSRIRSAR